MENEGKLVEKLLVIDDKEENLACIGKSIERLKENGSLAKDESIQNCSVDYCNNFDQGLKEAISGKYTMVVTDLFEGEYNPKGLKIALECMDHETRCGILTDGDRHRGSLGALRFYYQYNSKEYGDHPSVLNAQKLGLTHEELKKRNIDFCSLLIYHNGVKDKKDISEVSDRLKYFFGQ